MYTATQDGYVYAINANGTLKWDYFAEDFVFYIALDHNENVYFNGVYNNRLFCFSPDGNLKWTYNEVNIGGGPVIDDDGIIYIRSDELTALYPNGTVKWIVDFSDNDCYGYPSIAPDGTIILSGSREYITALDPSDGSRIWQYTLEPYLAIEEMSEASIGADGTIFVAYTFLNLPIGYMCAISNDGMLKWKKQITSDINPYGSITILSDPSIGKDGTVFITSWFHTSGSSIQGIGSYGYVHAFGSGDEKQVKITNPEDGYLYINNNKIKKNIIRKSIIFGDLHLNFNITSQNDVKRIVCILRSHHPFYNMHIWETKCQIFEIGLDTNPPYELVINVSKFKYNLRMYTLQINVDYKGGCTASDRITFYYLRRINPFTPMPKPTVKWKYYTGSYANTPTIYDNFIYFSCISGDAFCLNADDGSLVWEYPDCGYVEGGPVVIDNKVYFASRIYQGKIGKVYCLNALSGDVIWSRTIITPRGPVAVSDGKVFVGLTEWGAATTEILLCLNASTGETIWRWDEGNRGEIFGAPTVVDGKVYVGTTGYGYITPDGQEYVPGAVYCLDAEKGDVLWGPTIEDTFHWCSPAVAYGNVYIGSGLGGGKWSMGKFYCLNITDGSLVWERSRLYMSRGLTTVSSGCYSPAVADGKVYFGSNGWFTSNFYCLDAFTGDTIWTCRRFSIWGAFYYPAVADGKVFVGFDGIYKPNGKLVCFGE